jgi:hypothetical protein
MMKENKKKLKKILRKWKRINNEKMKGMEKKKLEIGIGKRMI